MSPPVTQHLRAGLPGRLVAVSSQMPLSQGCARSLSPVFPFVRLAVRSDTAERQSLLLTVGSEDQDCRLFAASIILCIACVCTQSCPIFCNPVDCSPPGSPVRGILQARILEWVAMPSPRDLPNPGWNPCLLCLLHWQVDFLLLVPPGKPSEALEQHY